MPRAILALLTASAALAGAPRHAAAQTLPSGVINAPPTVIGDNESIGSNTTLNVGEGGTVGFAFDAGLSDGSSTNVLVNISGGHVGNIFQAYSGSTVSVSGGFLSEVEANSGSTLIVSGGEVGSIAALSSSTVNISGGTVCCGLYASYGSTVNVSGGVMGHGHYYSEFEAEYGSTVNISGGILGDSFVVYSGSTASISGGAFGRVFRAHYGSATELIGGEFNLNGAPYAGSSISLSNGDIFTGTFADGSPFLFFEGASDSLEGVNLTATPLPAINTTPIVIDGTGAAAPAGLRTGQTLTLKDGGVLGDNFAVIDATLNIEGGVAPSDLDVWRSEVSISGGAIGDYLSTYSGSTVSISGGAVGKYFVANSGGTVNISGGALGERSRVYSGGTVNLNGGIVGHYFEAYPHSTVNINGGAMGDYFSAYSNSTVNISGGAVGRDFEVRHHSTVTISGGSVGRRFSAANDGTTTFVGGEFELNGAPYTGTSVTLTADDVFIGTFADGSPFLLNEGVSDVLQGVVLKRAVLPAIDTTPIVIESVDDASPAGLRTGQSLTLRDGGVLGGNFTAIDATLSIEGGRARGDVELARSEVTITGGYVHGVIDAYYGSTVDISGGNMTSYFSVNSGSVANISGGVLDRGLDVNSGSTVNISGGSVGRDMDVDSGSTVNITGGTVESSMDAHSGSVVNLSGGTVEGYFHALTGSEVNISGGTVGRAFSAAPYTTRLFGGEFELNGEPYTGTWVTVSADDVFTGTFADGSPFLFSEAATDRLQVVILEPATLPAIDTAPIVIDGTGAAAPAGLRAGQSLTLRDGGVLGDNFAVIDAILLIEGGEARKSVEVARSLVSISGSVWGAGLFDVHSGSTVNISDGTVSSEFRVYSGSTVNVTGGVVDATIRVFSSTACITGGSVRSLIALSGSTANITGGILNNLAAISGSTVSISGGSVGGDFEAYSGSTVDLIGSEFYLDGVMLDLELGIPTGLLERDVPLSGRYADGTRFEFELSSRRYADRHYFSPDAMLTLTLVPEPSAGVMAGLGVLAAGRRRRAFV